LNVAGKLLETDPGILTKTNEWRKVIILRVRLPGLRLRRRRRRISAETNLRFAAACEFIAVNRAGDSPFGQG
jgi:hypothetical protein